jgi:DNA (cytosine-5)-methyltransferase 1
MDLKNDNDPCREWSLMMTTQKLNILDLFSGIGGFSLGLEKTEGFKTVAFCEIDKDAQKVLRKHWPETPVFGDISKLNSFGLYERINDKIDIIAGGFPCQDISVGGRKKGFKDVNGNTTRSGLWFEYLRIIRELQPRWVIIENVGRLVGNGLEVVLGGLSESGYDAEWHTIEATHTGLPHRRERCYIIAHSRSLGLYEYFGKKRCLQTDQEWESAETYDQGKERISKSFQICPILSARDFDRFRSSNPDTGAALPDIRRVTNGIPKGLHEADRKRRIKQLGNSIVPFIAEVIGGRILAHEAVLAR